MPLDYTHQHDSTSIIQSADPHASINPLLTLRQAVVTLVDDQLRGADTTVLIAAQGEGRAIFPLVAFLASRIVVPYATAGGPINPIEIGWLDGFGNALWSAPGDLLTVSSASFTTPQFDIATPGAYYDVLDHLADQPLQVHTSPSLVDGDPDNTLTITVWYGVAEF